MQRSRGPELTVGKDTSDSLPALAAGTPLAGGRCSPSTPGSALAHSGKGSHSPLPGQVGDPQPDRLVPSACHKQVVLLTERKCFYSLVGSEHRLVPSGSPWKSSHSQLPSPSPRGFPLPLSLLCLQLNVSSTNGAPWKNMETSVSTARQLGGSRPLQYRPPFMNSAL